MHPVVDADSTWTMLTWNVLADRLAHGNFISAPDECLAWASRGDRILAELETGLDAPADVLCLQEVDHYGFLAERLAARGYVGTFAAKAEGRDGCCLFALAQSFALRDVTTLRYRDDTGRPESQLALLATLVPVSGAPAIRIATTHLKAKEGHEGQRRSQAAQLVEALAGFDGPVVVGGDFNDTPESPAYQVMRGSLRSGYGGLLDAEPAWTTWKVRADGEKKRTIDYIWHSAQLQATACLMIPADEDVGDGRLPSWQYPSDHLSLLVRFAPAPGMATT
jgi:nocturnin